MEMNVRIPENRLVVVIPEDLTRITLTKDLEDWTDFVCSNSASAPQRSKSLVTG
jgi:hypothetical protein